MKSGRRCRQFKLLLKTFLPPLGKRMELSQADRGGACPRAFMILLVNLAREEHARLAPSCPLLTLKPPVGQVPSDSNNEDEGH